MSAPEHGELGTLQGSATLTDPLSTQQSAHQQHATAAATELSSGEGGPPPKQPGIAAQHSHQRHATAAAADLGSGEGGPAPGQHGIAFQQRQNGVSSGADAEQDTDRRDSNKVASTSGLGKRYKL